MYVTIIEIDLSTKVQLLPDDDFMTGYPVVFKLGDFQARAILVDYDPEKHSLAEPLGVALGVKAISEFRKTEACSEQIVALPTADQYLFNARVDEVDPHIDAIFVTAKGIFLDINPDLVSTEKWHNLPPGAWVQFIAHHLVLWL
jgi:hypothetical protein